MEQVKNKKILDVENLKVYFYTKKGVSKAVDGNNFKMYENETLAIVGESGCGKSVTAMSILGLVDEPGKIGEDSKIMYGDKNLATLKDDEIRKIRGNDISMIFQEPMTSLNPVFTVGNQIMENILLHEDVKKEEAHERAVKLLDMVGISRPEKVVDNYPHQLSGGMRQRVMIAMALACNPKLLIADEPTTALDVTIQAQIIELLLELQQKENMALVLITHDLALVAEAAHKIIVMYAGQVVETGDAHAIFHAPRHPYTQALLRALPEFAQDKERLASLPGVVPGKYDRPNGCLLNPRCPYATDRCRAEEPALNMLADGRQSKCHYPLDDAGRPTL